MLYLPGCVAYSIPDFQVLSHDEELTTAETAALEALRPDEPADPNREIDLPEVRADFKFWEPGKTLIGGIRITEGLAQFQRAQYGVDTDLALDLLARYEAQLSDDEIFAHYFVKERRASLLTISARPLEAVKELDDLERLEIQIFGTNMNTLSLKAQLHLWWNKHDAAKALYARVLIALGGWRIPTSYFAYPTNIEDLLHTGFTQARAQLGLSITYLLEKDFARAFDWSEIYHGQTRDVVGVFEHPIYGIFAKPDAGAYYGYAWALSTLAAARAASTKDIAANEKYFAAAIRYGEAADAADLPLTTDCLRELAAFGSGAVPLPTYRVGPLEEPDTVVSLDDHRAPPARTPQLRSWFGLPRTDGGSLGASQETLDKIATRFDQIRARQDRALPVPEGGSIKLPAAGERSVYGFVVIPEMATALDAYLRGDAEEALAALDRADLSGVAEPDRGMLAFELSFIRAQTLIMAGRAADAEGEISRTSGLEIAAFGSNLNSRALRGEARVWLGDLEAATRDLAQVAAAIGDWRLPTYTVCPPADLPQVVTLVRAQARTYAGMTLAQLMRGDYQAAEAWAGRTEELLQDIFFMVFHPLYGAYAEVHPDIYYGRGIVLGALGAARVANSRDPAAGDDDITRALAYFDAMNYATGRATIEAFRARALMSIGRADIAEPLAREAAALATEQGLADLVWQLEALRGEALLQLGRDTEAERAYRRAQAAVDLVSGTLASDRSKRRFGVGKEDITRRLVELDIARDDMDALFQDLERGRARAFVDMLADRPVALGRQRDLVAEIKAVDAEIRAQRLRNAAPEGATSAGRAREQSLLARRRKRVEILRGRDPELADALSVATRSLASVRASLGPGDRLAYGLPPDTERHLRFLLVSSDTARVVTATLREPALRTLVAAFQESGRAPQRSARNALLRQRAPETGDRRSERSRPRELAGVSVEPLTALGQRKAAEGLTKGLGVPSWNARGTLYVVPRGDLYLVPWGAMDVRTPVVVLPTGGWLGRGAHDADGRTAATVLGDPALAGVLPQLPGAKAEAESVARLYRIESLTGGGATEASLRAAIGGGAEVLHLATHGTFDAEAPMEAAIFLAGAGEPDPLTAAELFARPLSARLVVLSACETGLGHAEAGDDFLGLARSFYLGGAVSVVNSLWPVLDEPTRMFMEIFHRHAKDGAYGKGWLAARDALKARGYPPSVYGAFILGGAARGF